MTESRQHRAQSMSHLRPSPLTSVQSKITTSPDNRLLLNHPPSLPSIPTSRIAMTSRETTLYEHTNTKVTKFKFNNKKIENEPLLAYGVLRVQRPKGIQVTYIIFPDTNKTRYPLLPRSRCWEVGPGEFALKAMEEGSFWRVEIVEDAESRDKAIELRSILERGAAFEKWPCPFRDALPSEEEEEKDAKARAPRMLLIGGQHEADLVELMGEDYSNGYLPPASCAPPSVPTSPEQTLKRSRRNSVLASGASAFSGQWKTFEEGRKGGEGEEAANASRRRRNTESIFGMTGFSFPNRNFENGEDKGENSVGPGRRSRSNSILASGTSTYSSPYRTFEEGERKEEDRSIPSKNRPRRHKSLHLPSRPFSETTATRSPPVPIQRRRLTRDGLHPTSPKLLVISPISKEDSDFDEGISLTPHLQSPATIISSDPQSAAKPKITTSTRLTSKSLFLPQQTVPLSVSVSISLPTIPGSPRPVTPTSPPPTSQLKPISTSSPPTLRPRPSISIPSTSSSTTSLSCVPPLSCPPSTSSTRPTTSSSINSPECPVVEAQLRSLSPSPHTFVSPHNPHLSSHLWGRINSTVSSASSVSPSKSPTTAGGKLAEFLLGVAGRIASSAMGFELDTGRKISEGWEGAESYSGMWGIDDERDELVVRHEMDARVF